MSREAAARRSKARRRAARLARAEPDAGGLPNHDQRRTQAVTRTGGLPSSRRRRPEFRHTIIAILSAVAVMAVSGAALGLVPAIEAAGGNGTIGSFVVGYQPCLLRRGGCEFTGIFEAPGGDVVSHVAYVGSLPAGAGEGSRIPARYTGYQQAYPLRGSLTWAVDLIFMLLIGSVVGFLVWLLPVGLGQRRAGSSSDAGPRGVEL
jgi:hypothetical protein